MMSGESYIRDLVNNAWDLVCEADDRGIITFINNNFCRLFGYSKDQLIGFNINEFLHSDDFPNLAKLVSEECDKISLRFRNSEGSFICMEVSGKLFISPGRISSRIFIGKEINSGSFDETLIGETEIKYRSLVDNIPDIIIRINRDLYITYANKNALNFFNLNSIDLDKNRLDDIILNIENNQELKHAVLKTFLNQRQLHLQIKNNIAHGPSFYNCFIVFEKGISYFFDSCICVFRDLTEMLNIQFELQKLSKILDESINSIVVTDRNGIIEYVNKKFIDITGFNRDELIGKKPNILKSGLTDPHEYEILWKTIKEGKTWKGIFINRKKNGEIYHEFTIISPILDSQGVAINYLAIKEDITAQIEREKELQENKDKLNFVFEAINVGTWNWDITNDTLTWDRQCENISGYPFQLNNKISVSWIFKKIPRGDRQIVQQSLNKILLNDQIFELNFPIIDYGGNIKHLYIKAKIDRLPDRSPVMIDGILLDITRLKITEHNLKQRNEELNQFVYMVSHDLRAPLASIQGIVELERLQNPNKSAIKHINLIENRVLKLDQFVRQILSHSRNLNTDIVYSPIALKKIINTCFDELEFLNNSLNIRKIVKSEGGQFFSDANRLHEIFRNLISNSIKYIDYDKSDPFIRINAKAGPNEIFISFEDNGIGIEEKYIGKIFDMFYRANERSDGSGLGLYIVKQVIEKLGGRISVTSEKKSGTRFEIILPNQKTYSQ